MTEKNMTAIRAAALALVRQAELAGVVVTIETVPKVPLAMQNYSMEVDVRARRGAEPVAVDLSEQDAGLLEQGASMLEALAGDERNRGNDSAAMGAECSAHAVRSLAMKLLVAPTELPVPQLEMNDELLEILGRPNFKCAHVAEALRAGGQKIPNRAENEQAAVILFLLNHYLADQANWWAKARAALQSMTEGGSK
jgi:hypothetical protein